MSCTWNRVGPCHNQWTQTLPCTLSPRISAYCFLTSPLLLHREIQHKCKKEDFQGPLSISASLVSEKVLITQVMKRRFCHRWTLLSCFAEAKWKSRQIRTAATSYCREQTLQLWDGFQKLSSKTLQLKLGNGIFRRGRGWLPLFCHQEEYLQNQLSPLSEKEVTAEFPLLYFTWLSHHAWMCRKQQWCHNSNKPYSASSPKRKAKVLAPGVPA